jgi:uncharacterized membrane protein
MRKTGTFGGFAALVAGFGVLSLTPSVEAGKNCPPRFTVEVFQSQLCPPPFGPPDTRAWAINCDGVAAGHFDTFDCNDAFGDQAYTWTPQTGIVAIPYPPGYKSTTVFGISDLGVVVGKARTTPSPQGKDIAFVYENGVLTILGTGPGGNRSEGLDINSQGVIVGNWGNSQTGPNPQACMWQDGVFTDLNPLLGTVKSSAFAINEEGVIVGWRGATTLTKTAFRLQNGVAESLPVPLGTLQSEAEAINALGDIAGQIQLLDRRARVKVNRACVWIDGEYVLPDLLPGYLSSFAVAITDDRWVLGFCTDSVGTEGEAPFLWINGVTYDVRTLVEKDEWLQLRIMYELSAQHHIAGRGSVSPPAQGFSGSVGVVLIPVDPILADLDCDVDVDGDDLGMMLTVWGASDNDADLNADGTVNGADLGLLLAGWTSGG